MFIKLIFKGLIKTKLPLTPDTFYKFYNIMEYTVELTVVYILN